ncbi:MAG: ATP-binding protein [Rhodocyclaceae bacterium]|nr:ATP-binding protein [Rhodocyclaceae bacterium]
MKLLLALTATLGALFVLLLVTASAEATFLVPYTPLLIGLNALAALLLVALVAAMLRRLWRDVRQGVFGARLKSRFLGMFTLLALVPGLFVYGVSMLFAVKSIDAWFDVRVEAALEGGIDLGRGIFETMQSDLLAKGRAMAYTLGETAKPGAALLNRLREQAGVDTATLFSSSGQLIANSSGDLARLLPALPDPALVRQARSSAGFARVESEAAGGYVVRAWLPVSGYPLGSETLVLQLEQPVPAAIVQSAEAVEAAWRDYQELQLGRAGLKHLYTLTLTFTLLLALFAAIALAFFLAARLAKPLLMLAEGTRAVAAGDFTPRATLETDDELGILTRSFNEMTQQLREAREARDAAQRAAVWGEVARRLAHEIKNPLTPIQLSAERLQMKLSGKLSPEDAAMLERATKTIIDQVEALKAMVNDFRDYARLPPPKPVALDLNALINEVLELYGEGAVPITVKLDPSLPRIHADPDQLRQVLHNLIKNAAEALAGQNGAGSITVSTESAGEMAELMVADTGSGFPPEILARAFEPYVTTKPKGTGLGLAIVKKIVDDHGGTIRLANRPAEAGGGAEVRVRLPVHRPSPRQACPA